MTIAFFVLCIILRSLPHAGESFECSTRRNLTVGNSTQTGYFSIIHKWLQQWFHIFLIAITYPDLILKSKTKGHLLVKDHLTTTASIRGIILWKLLHADNHFYHVPTYKTHIKLILLWQKTLEFNWKIRKTEIHIETAMYDKPPVWILIRVLLIGALHCILA